MLVYVDYYNKIFSHYFACYLEDNIYDSNIKWVDSGGYSYLESRILHDYGITVSIRKSMASSHYEVNLNNDNDYIKFMMIFGI